MSKSHFHFKRVMNQDFCSLLPSRDGSHITVFVLQMQTIRISFNYHAMFVFVCVTLNVNNFESTPRSAAVTTQLLKLNCYSTPVAFFTLAYTYSTPTQTHRAFSSLLCLPFVWSSCCFFVLMVIPGQYGNTHYKQAAPESIKLSKYLLLKTLRSLQLLVFIIAI